MSSDPIAYDFFRREGYLVARDVLSREQCGAVLEAYVQAFPGADRASAEGAFFRTDAVSARLSPVREALDSKSLRAVLTHALGRNIVRLTNRHDHLTVNGGLGKAARLHRDVLQWSRNILSVILYINIPEERDHVNGTLVVPGSHLLASTGRVNNGGTWLDESPHARLGSQAVAVPATLGTALLMDGMLYHAALTKLRAPGAATRGLGAARIALAAAFRAVDELHPQDLSPSGELFCGEQIYRGRDPVASKK